MLTRAMLGVLVFVAIQLLIAISNWWVMQRLHGELEVSQQPFVSVLVPARNEEENIFTCINSLCRQKYANYEVVVLNDHSKDATGVILAGLANTYPQLRVIDGSKLPAGWYGKHWACWNLAKEAGGKYLLFTDADTRHEPGMLQAAVAKAEQENLDLLTAAVKQDMQTWGERLTVSFPVWSIMTLCPVWLGKRFGWSAFSAVNGQFMLFKRNSYLAVGGHARVRSHAVDDVALGRNIIAEGYRWAMYDASALVSCRMYRSFGQAVQGFAKNYFALFDYHVALAAFVWLWMAYTSWFPLTLLVLGMGGVDLPSSALVAAAAVMAVQTVLWLLPVRRFQMPWQLLVLHPIIVGLASVVGLLSLILTVTGRAVWKGRRLGDVKVKWF